MIPSQSSCRTSYTGIWVAGARALVDAATNTGPRTSMVDSERVMAVAGGGRCAPLTAVTGAVYGGVAVCTTTALTPVEGEAAVLGWVTMPSGSTGVVVVPVGAGHGLLDALALVGGVGDPVDGAAVAGPCVDAGAVRAAGGVAGPDVLLRVSGSALWARPGGAGAGVCAADLLAVPGPDGGAAVGLAAVVGAAGAAAATRGEVVGVVIAGWLPPGMGGRGRAVGGVSDPSGAVAWGVPRGFAVVIR
jgi:hypothetical protein